MAQEAKSFTRLKIVAFATPAEMQTAVCRIQQIINNLNFKAKRKEDFNISWKKRKKLANNYIYKF